MKKIRFKEYYIVVFASFVFSIICLWTSHGMVLDNLVFGRGGDLFMDFFNHISYVSAQGRTKVYDQGYNACFPPLAYILYGALAKIIPFGSTTMYNAMATKPYAMLIYAEYCVILALFSAYSINKMFNEKTVSLITGLSIFLSNVFIFGVLERGNSVWIVCILLLYAIQFRDSKNAYKRELALILIAVAAAFKVYPALFGLLYLVERRWKESIKLLLYGIVFFFVPFFAFGGIEGLKKFIDNQMILQNSSNSIGNLFFIANAIQSYSSNKGPFYSVLLGVFSVLSVVSLIAEKERWKRAYIICAMMIVLPKWSSNYTVFFLLIPLVFFLRDAFFTPVNRIRAFLFAGIFSLILFCSGWKTSSYSIGLQEIIIYGCTYSMLISIYLSALTKLVKQLQNKNQQRRQA